MSWQGPLFAVIPDDTQQIAHAVFPKGNRYLRLRDTLGPLFMSTDFQQLYHREGRPAVDPARLAVVTILQFVERLSDSQAADAVRSRIDWKYLLALLLPDPGFDASVLSEFRTRLLEHGAEGLLFDLLLTQFRDDGLLRARGRQRTDSTHVLAAIRALNRLGCHPLAGPRRYHAPCPQQFGRGRPRLGARPQSPMRIKLISLAPLTPVIAGRSWADYAVCWSAPTAGASPRAARAPGQTGSAHAGRWPTRLPCLRPGAQP